MEALLRRTRPYIFDLPMHQVPFELLFQITLCGGATDDARQFYGQVVSEIETVVGVKEASGNISQIAAIFQVVPESFAVLSGDDAITLPVIALGGVGVISVVSNEVPFAMARLASLCLEGDFPAAREMQRRLHPLMEINFVESNPGPVKAALGLMGLIEPVLRLPAVPPKPESVVKIEKILLGLGLIPETPESEPLEARLAV